MWWLRADLGVTLNVGNVAAWADQSGVGDPNRNVVQVAGGQQPAFVAANPAYNNQPTIHFTGASSDVLANPGPWSAGYSQPYTLIIVGNGSSVLEYFLARSNGATWFLYDTGVHYSTFGGAQLLYTEPLSNNPTIFILTMNDPTTNCRFSALTPDATVGNAAAGAITQFAIGAENFAGAGGLTGDIAEVLGYSRILTLAEITQLESVYLGPRYGIAVGP